MALPPVSLVQVGLKIKEMLEQYDDGVFEDVWYGDQDLIPRTPAAAIELGTLERELYATGHRTQNRLPVNIILYLCRLDDPNQTKLDVDLMAEDVMHYINANKNMSGFVTFGYVEQFEAGYALRGKALMRAALLSWAGISVSQV